MIGDLAAAAGWAGAAGLSLFGILAVIDTTEVLLGGMTLTGVLGAAFLGWQQHRREHIREEREAELKREADLHQSGIDRADHFMDQLQGQLDRQGEALRTTEGRLRELQETSFEQHRRLVELEIGSRRLVAQVYDLGGVPIFNPDRELQERPPDRG